MQRVIGVLSGKGGVGKTVTSINLSAALGELGHDTTLVDGDISSANLTVHLGLPDASASLQDVLEEREGIYRTIRHLPGGLKIVPASLSLEKSLVDMRRLKNVIRDGLGGTVIIDSPPGFSKDLYHIIDACDEVLVVANPDVPSITDAIKVVEIAKKMDKDNLGIVLTRVERSSSEIRPDEVETLCEVPILGIVPEDRRVKASVYSRTPLIFHAPHARAAVEYRRIAAGLVGREYREPAIFAVKRFLRF